MLSIIFKVKFENLTFIYLKDLQNKCIVNQMDLWFFLLLLLQVRHVHFHRFLYQLSYALSVMKVRRLLKLPKKEKKKLFITIFNDLLKLKKCSWFENKTQFWRVCIQKRNHCLFSCIRLNFMVIIWKSREKN